MKGLIKAALENTVLCRGANSAKESYEYAEKMQAMIVDNLITRLESTLVNPETTVEDIKKLIEELKS
jgi:hypothetical protein